MGTDNVDIFKKIVFSIPETGKITAGIFLLGLIYSGLTYLALKAFASTPIYPVMIPLLAIFLYIVPSLISGEALHRFLPDYPRRWGLFLALANQTVIFGFSLVISGADSAISAWNVFWLAITTVFMSNFLVLLLTLGYRHVRRISLLSLVQPLAILAAFHVFMGRYLELEIGTYALNLLVIPLAGLLMLGIFAITEYLLRSNVSNISVLGLTSALLRKKQEELDLGYPSRPDVQTLEIQNQDSKTTVAIPWIHPGPLEGFGGSEVSSRIIEDLNRKGEGFFFHVPATHKSDPANPDASDKILEAIEEPGMNSKASKMIKRSYKLPCGEFSFYGRRFGDKKIVFLEATGIDFDDYETSIFREVIDTEKVALVDLHCHEKNGDSRRELWYGTETAEKMRQSLVDFLEELEGLETGNYEAGFSTVNGGTPVFALVEKVEDQETVILGLEGNEAGKNLRQARDRYSEEFDEALIFSTDSHRSIHELSRDRQIEARKLEEAVESAKEKVSDAGIGLTSSKTSTMKLLQEDYLSLVLSINILIRLIPLGLILVYIGLLAWLF